MGKKIRLLMCFFLFCAAFTVSAQEIPFIKAEQITHWKTMDTDTVWVINFWATWCAPCVEELPAFEKLNQKMAGRKVRVVLVSNDFKKAVETRLIPFVRDHHLTSRVVYMNESNPNGWINLVDPSWSGALPATLIISKKRNKTLFFERQMGYKELKKAVLSVL